MSENSTEYSYNTIFDDIFFLHGKTDAAIAYHDLMSASHFSYIDK